MATVTESSSTLWSAPATDNAILEEPKMRNDLLFEVVDHQIRELPPIGIEEALKSHRHCFRSSALLPGPRSFGRVVPKAALSLEPPQGNQTQPTRSGVRVVSAVASRSTGFRAAAAWEIVPNLAIEVVSPTNLANVVLEMIEDYFHTGVERVWVIYPTVAKLYDYDSPSSVRILTRDKTLEGGAALGCRKLQPWRSCLKTRALARKKCRRDDVAGACQPILASLSRRFSGHCAPGASCPIRGDLPRR